MINLKNYKLPKESSDGNIEYKREIHSDRQKKYLIQMIYRLNEGNGVAYYYLGVDDNGNFYNWDNNTKKNSLKNLIDIISQINAHVKYILEFNTGYKVKIYSEKYKNNFLWY